MNAKRDKKDRHDANGNLTSANDKNPGGVPQLTTAVGYAYDHLDRLVSASSGGTGLASVAISYERDLEGNVTRVSGGPQGEVVISPTSVGVPGSITSQAGEFLLGYDRRLLLTSLNYPNGAYALFEYDDGGNLLEAKHLPPHGAFITRHGYGYDAVDRRVSATGPDGRHEYGHDVRDWLTSRATGPEGAAVADETYAYDDVGNRTSGHLAGGQDYGAERLNRLLLDDAFTYTYDGDGNLTQKVDRANPANVTTFSWDAQGRLSSVILPGGAVVRYRYDVLGRRVERAVGAAAESYAYDGHDLVGVYDGAGALKESYIYGPGIDNVLAGVTHSQSGTQVVYYHKDGLNSVTAVTDAEHNVLRRYAYDSFGNLATQPQDRFTYTGRELDSDTGLYFYRARYYDAKAGRFISEDPVWDVNLYPYVGNMPMSFIDPFGLFKELENNRLWLADPNSDVAGLGIGNRPNGSSYFAGTRLESFSGRDKLGVNLSFFSPIKPDAKTPKTPLGFVMKNGEEIRGSYKAYDDHNLNKPYIGNRGFLAYSPDAGFYVGRGKLEDVPTRFQGEGSFAVGGLGYLNPSLCSSDKKFAAFNAGDLESKKGQGFSADQTYSTERAFLATDKNGRLLVYRPPVGTVKSQYSGFRSYMQKHRFNPVGVLFNDGGGSFQLNDRGQFVNNSARGSVRYPPINLIVGEK